MAPQPASTFGWFQPSPIPDVATAETIRFMCGCIDGSARNADVQAIAQDAVARFGALGAGGGDPQTDADLARAVYWYVRYSVKRLHHGEFKATVAAFPEKKQLLISPDVLLFESYPQGDCSAFTMAICAVLKCLGVRYELVAVAVDPSEPSIFTHVYPRAVLKDGTRLVLDAHAMPGPGQEVPPQDVFRKQVFDSQGSPVADAGVLPRFKGLHQYQWRGMGDSVCVAYDDNGDCTDYEDSSTFQAATLPLAPTYTATSGEDCAFGVDSSGNCLAASSAQQVAAANALANPSLAAPAGYPSGSMTAPSQSSAAWANFATAALKSGLTLAEINSIQPGTVVGANGQILRQSTGLAVPVGSGVTAAFGSSGSTMLLLAGLGIAAILFFKGKG